MAQHSGAGNGAAHGSTCTGPTSTDGSTRGLGA